MNIREKIKVRLSSVEIFLREGKHLASDEGKAEAEALVESASKFFSILSDEDRDFINAARLAIDSNMAWE